MSNQQNKDFIPGQGKLNLPIVGGLILFSVIMGTTSLGFIPMPTAAKSATIMHLPTIVASLLEGWPIGVVVGTVFGITSMYAAQSPMASDPLVAIVPRMAIGLTSYATYMALSGRGDYLRLGASAVIGTLTNTVLFLGFSVLQGYMALDVAISIAITHGGPEVLVAIVIVIPSVIVLRKARSFLQTLH